MTGMGDFLEPVGAAIARPVLRARLVSELSSLAIYNDKGFEWSGHTPEQVDAYRAKAQRELEELVALIGEAHLPPAFIQGLRSGRVAVDWSGNFCEMCR